VDQQREQHRIRQSPALTAHALTVGPSLEPLELKRAPPSLLG
jgi:hypothetical protein